MQINEWLAVIATATGIVSAFVGLIWWFARKELEAYKALDKHKDLSERRLHDVDKDLRRIENDVSQIKLVHALELRSMVERLNRHRRDINEVAGYLRKSGSFQPRRDTNPGPN
ncbi:hypothetical protein HC928_11260, partial [bacterium]|nr:hypothetical protein [bacterium]